MTNERDEVIGRFERLIKYHDDSAQRFRGVGPTAHFHTASKEMAVTHEQQANDLRLAINHLRASEALCDAAVAYQGWEDANRGDDPFWKQRRNKVRDRFLAAGLRFGCLASTTGEG